MRLQGQNVLTEELFRVKGEDVVAWLFVGSTLLKGQDLEKVAGRGAGFLCWHG